MRSAYKFLAYAIDALILLQAASIAWAVFGLSKWIDDGHTLTKSAMDGDQAAFPEATGFAIHSISGSMVIPLLVLLLVVVAFFADVPDGVKWAAMLFAGIVVEVGLGLISAAVPALGFVHGFWALLLFWLAWRAARQAGVPATYDAAAVSTER